MAGYTSHHILNPLAHSAAGAEPPAIITAYLAVHSPPVPPEPRHSCRAAQPSSPRVETGSPGTYVIGASTRHRDFGLSAADFNAYLEHDGIPDVLKARRRDGELEKDVLERYGKHVKTILQVGHERTDDYKVRLGYPAEIVPLVNPYVMSVGDELSCSVSSTASR